MIPSEELFDFIVKNGKDNAIYKSVFLYPETHIEKIIDKKSMANIFCERNAYWVPVDIDKGDNSDQRVLEIARATLQQLFEEGLCEDNIIVWFSGTGYHIDIHADCFNIQPQEEYPYLIKRTLSRILPDIDTSIYSRSSIIRAPFSLNMKSNRHKIPLTVEELNNLPYTEIHELSSNIETIQTRFNNFVDWIKDKFGDGELAAQVIKEVPKIREMNSVIEPSKIASCIYKIWEQGPVQGSRNQCIIRLASHFRRSGIPSSACKAALREWNNNSLDERILYEKIEYVYNKGYQFGCQDKLLSSYCSTHCTHYKRKDLTLDLITADDMQKHLEDRLITDYDNKVIHLDKMLGLPEGLDCKIYPGELVTIFGLPGGNKSTFVQNIMMGVDFQSGVPNENYQIPSIYFHSELASWVTHRRHLQIASGLKKEEITDITAGKIYKENKRFLDHIQVVVKPATLNMIEQAIAQTTTELVVIDYIETIDVEEYVPNEQAKIKLIMQRLASLAVTKNIIIILVSQTNRAYAKEGILDLYAGYGSGSIEKSSRKVIGILAKEGNVREIEMFKNQDGNLFKTWLEYQPSWRLVKI